MFKVKIFRGSHATTKIFYLQFFINEYFFRKFPNYGILYFLLFWNLIHHNVHISVFGTGVCILQYKQLFFVVRVSVYFCLLCYALHAKLINHQLYFSLVTTAYFAIPMSLAPAGILLFLPTVYAPSLL